MILFKKVETGTDAEILRQHRNTCKDFMTRSTEYITAEQQQEWFSTAKTKYELYLAYDLQYVAIICDVGYGLIHKHVDQSLVTGGLLPMYRGQGIGQELFQFLINACPKTKPIRLVLLKTNSRAFIVYIKLGFKIIGEDDKLQYMEYEYDSSI